MQIFKSTICVLPPIYELTEINEQTILIFLTYTDACQRTEEHNMFTGVGFPKEIV